MINTDVSRNPRATRPLAVNAVSLLLSKFANPIPVGDEWKVPCPAHDDQNPSLYIRKGEGGRVLVSCMSQKCPTESIVAALGLTLADLMPPRDQDANRMPVTSPTKPKKQKTEYESADAAIESLERWKGESVARWAYRNESGEIVGWVLRFNREDGGKEFLPVAKVDSGRWVCGGMPSPRPLYNLPEILVADPDEWIHVCEGEKCADVFRTLNLIGTTSSNGAGSAGKSDWSPLAGRKVAVFPDADEAGEKYAAEVMTILEKLDPPAEVVIVRIPGLPQKGDVFDWSESRDGADVETLRGELCAMVEDSRADAVSGEGDSDQGDDFEDGELDDDIGINVGSQLDLSDPEERTELSLSRRLLRKYGERIRYVSSWGKFIVWTGRGWKIDHGEVQILRWMKKIVDGIWSETKSRMTRESCDFAVKAARHSTMRSAINLAASELSIDHDKLDADPWLLNCQNGTINLRTGELRPHNPKDYLTKSTRINFNPSADRKRWTRFLMEIFGSEQIVRFSKRFAGYALTGLTVEQILLIAYGVGANGKTCLFNSLLKVMGDYADQSPPDLLMARRGEVHPTELATLFRLRLAITTETERGGAFAESKLKQLTGSDRIATRMMRQDFWTFEPSHKLTVLTNHPPRVKGTDHGIRRRLLMLPFNRVFSGDQIDHSLPQKLASEAEGILAWMVEGALDWQREGLSPPPEVLAATENYLHENDTIGRFVEERCVRRDDGFTTIRFANLYSELENYCNETGDNLPNRKIVTAWLKDNGCESYSNNGRCYRGIGLLATERTE